MCKKMTVAYGDFIGSRMVGWCVYNGKDYSFLSSKSIINHIKQGNLVNGLCLGDEGDLLLDSTFAKSLMGKSGLSFNSIMAVDEEESVMNKYYALVKVVKAKEGNSYHFITNRCGYEVFTEEQVKAMLAILDMGGIQMGSDGSLMIHKGIEVEDTGEAQNKGQRASKDGKGVS